MVPGGSSTNKPHQAEPLPELPPELSFDLCDFLYGTNTSSAKSARIRFPTTSSSAALMGAGGSLINRPMIPKCWLLLAFVPALAWPSLPWP
jgi:hypothetical protein